MDATRFVSNQFGRVVRTAGDHDFCAFVPSEIPRDIDLDRNTVMWLSVADDALGRLAGVGRLLPNPHLLAQASLSEVFRAAAGAGTPPSTDVGEVRNYIAALEHGLALLDDLPAPHGQKSIGC